MLPNTGRYVNIVADSVNPDGVRITSIEAGFERFILAELNTHRKFSRNSGSSRAIPTKIQLDRIKNYPFVPEAFPVNEPGMSATEYFYPGSAEYDEAAGVWLEARDNAVEAVEKLLEQNVHKQTANRLLEPFMYHTAIITATDWDNFYNLRISPHAQPEINKLAIMMRDAMDASTPVELNWGCLHLPYVDDDECDELISLGYDNEFLKKLSAGRCAAVTLLNQNKKDVQKDVARTNGLISNGHMSPLEHPATAKEYSRSMYEKHLYSNFDVTWQQFRKEIPGEDIYRGV